MMSNLLKLLGALIVIVAAIKPLVWPTSNEIAVIEAPVNKTVTVQPEPTVHLTPLPEFAEINDVKEKKRAFFGYLGPLVEQVNREITREREFLLHHGKKPINPKDIARFEKLAKKYSVELDQSYAEIRRRLINRVDKIPVELVLMQAANESAWGTSRFAIDANNLFGQWCFKKGCGVIPEGRPAGKSYEVRKFEHPIASVRSYFHNLNTGWAYKDFRQLRAKQRAELPELDGYALADGLIKYSTRRDAYVMEIKQMIKANQSYLDEEWCC